MREAFLSLPSLDTVDARLAAAEAGVVRVEAAVDRVLRGLAHVYQRLGALEAALQPTVEEAEAPRGERQAVAPVQAAPAAVRPPEAPAPAPSPPAAPPAAPVEADLHR